MSIMDIRQMRSAAPKPGYQPRGTVITQAASAPQAETADRANVTTESSGLPTTEPAFSVRDSVIREYLEYLKENDLTEDDIFAVLDNFLTHGQVVWEFPLLGKIPVKLKSRPSWMVQYVLKKMESDFPQSMVRYQEIVNGYNVAGSLVHYNGDDKEVTDEEAMEKNHVFVRSLSYQLFNAILRKLIIFDRLVAVATSDWAIENFTKRQSEGSGRKP